MRFPMALPRLILALADLLMCAGCSDLVSLHPFVSDQEAVLDARLPGVWIGGEDLYIVRQDGKGYSIAQLDQKGPAVYRLKAKLFKVGEALILDLTPAEEDGFQVAVHTPMRLWLEGAMARIAFLDSEWLRKTARGQLAVQDVRKRLLITSPGEEVKRFLLATAGDGRAHGDSTVLTRQQ
jgi:hypothetical protein